MDLTSDSFKALLSWLDPDPEVACRKYITIHSGLVRIFTSKGFSDAESLADKTVNRVIKRLPDIRENYVGKPVNYFRGVARKIMHEEWDGPEIAMDVLPERPTFVAESSDEYECLCRCLKELSPEEREFILDYHIYDYEGHEKIEHHKRMAEEENVETSTLRVRAFRLRAALEKCIEKCVGTLRVKQNTPQRASSEKSDAVSGLNQEQ